MERVSRGCEASGEEMDEQERLDLACMSTLRSSLATHTILVIEELRRGGTDH